MQEITLTRVKVLSWATLLIVVDQITKIIAMDALKDSPGARVYLGDFFRFVYAENSGVFLGLGRNLPEPVRFWLFTLLVGAILTWILVETMRRPSRDPWRLAAITMILSGGLSNLIDRIIRDGAVVDFMNMGITWPISLRTGIFNVADMLITAGAILFIFREFKAPEPKPEEPTPSGPEAASVA